jgi:hypothetical protein
MTRVDNLRAVRYCELWFIGGDPITKNLYGHVFNTSQLNNKADRLDTCPGPMNMFVSLVEFPPADYRAVVRPNFDTRTLT